MRCYPFVWGRERSVAWKQVFQTPVQSLTALVFKSSAPCSAQECLSKRQQPFPTMLEAHRSLQVPFGGVSRTSEPAMTQTKDGLHQADTELSHHRITETGQGTSQARLKSGQGLVCWLTSFLPVILEATSLYSGEKVSYFCFNPKCYSQAQ